MGRLFTSRSKKDMFRTTDLERILTRCDSPPFFRQFRAWLRWHFQSKPVANNLPHMPQSSSHTTHDINKEG